MPKGRKPKPAAQRRGGLVPAVAQSAPIEPPAVAKPPHVLANPTLSACWDLVTGSSPSIRQADAPLVDAYCYWYAVYLQACGQTITPDGRVVPLYGRKDEHGRIDPETVRANPDIQTAKKATEMLMRLAGLLQLTPEARDRASLTHALTQSTQADVVNKTIENYRRFKAATRGGLPHA